jgi:hypothetical protein
MFLFGVAAPSMTFVFKLLQYSKCLTGKLKAGILPCIPISLNVKDDNRFGALKKAQKILDGVMRVKE